MILEEAVQWCIEHCVEVEFYTERDEPIVSIYQPGEFSSEDSVFLGEGATLIEAVQEAIRKEEQHG